MQLLPSQFVAYLAVDTTSIHTTKPLEDPGVAFLLNSFAHTNTYHEEDILALSSTHL